MAVKRRIFVSAPRDVRLHDQRYIEIKRAIVGEIERLGYEPQIFLGPTGGVGLPEGGWDLAEVERVVKRCVGAVIIGLPFWKTMFEDREIWLPTDYCQYEGAVAHSYGIPILAIAIGIHQRVIFDDHARLHACSITLKEDLAPWLQTDDFRRLFESWNRQIAKRHDVFLGYCSESAGTAAQIQLRLERMGASVLNYAMDFRAGRSILSEIDNASANCSSGVFLFSENDPLDGGLGAAPRDNVVFEAGYFMSSKGADRCLIIREGAPKMPADIEGTIYVDLNKGGNVAAIEGRLRSFLENNL